MKMTAVLNDITRLRVDAIVNAANCSLLGGGGVDGAIHRAAGPRLYEACLKFGGCRTGEARITPGFNLPARFVIHTPGPVWRGGGHGEPELLRSCYLNSLALAEENDCRTVAFPGISIGVYRYPLEAAVKIAVDTVGAWAGTLPEEVVFCAFSENVLEAYQRELDAFQA
jgi:O-acetyl-ADP-ribose deacetylase (regulator of RNase III)